MKFAIQGKLAGLIQHETDRQTQATFEALFANKQLGFYLECVEGRFEIPQEIELRGTKKLVHDDNEAVQRSLFDFVSDDLNDYEKSVALYLDHHPEVLWWYRNLVGPQCFSIQGYKRNKIYPDFVVQQGHSQKPVASRRGRGKQGQAPQGQRRHELQTKGRWLLRESWSESPLAKARRELSR